MKTRMIFFFVGIAVMSAGLFTGCSSTGVHASANVTQVQLAHANYKIVATSVAGKAQAEYLFGASMSIGMYNQTFALIPLTKDRALYKLALADLWKNFEAAYCDARGRRLALINVRYDSEAANFFFYTRPRITLVADVIEFTE